MSLITLNLPESATSSLLALLERLVTAVERIAGPVIEYRPPTPATMEDYAYVDPETAQRIHDAEREFALQHMVVPGSPAYVQLVESFERDVAAAYGEETVSKLPWKVQGGVTPR